MRREAAGGSPLGGREAHASAAKRERAGGGRRASNITTRAQATAPPLPVPRGTGAAGKITTSTNATTAPTTGELATSHTITGRAAACAYVALGAVATE